MFDAVLDKILYPAPDSSYTEDTFPGFLLNIGGADTPSERIPALLSCPRDPQTGELRPADFVLLSIHGNAMDIGHLGAECQMFADELACHVLAPEFPGYGVYKDAKPTEAGIDQAAEAALRFVTQHMRCPPERTIVLGRSIGTGIAARLAAKWGGEPASSPVGGLVLISPYVSIPEVVRDHAPSCIASWIRHRWRPEEDLETCEAPVLLLHGEQDTLIKSRHSEMLWHGLNETQRPSRRLEMATDLMHKGAKRSGRRDQQLWLRISAVADHNVWDYTRDLVEPIRSFVSDVQYDWRQSEPPPKELPLHKFRYPESTRRRQAIPQCTFCL
eukprot:Hpha_TRINITY_DN16637_c1_g7::TRINITY_DN16637_c1_g7_i1::g.179149::m.179149